MTVAISVQTVKDEQVKLQEAYNTSRLRWDKANADMMAKKIKLCAFRDKYGRVIAMMEADKED